MGVTEAAKIKISNRLGSTAKSAFFQIADSGRLSGPLKDLGSKIDFEGGGGVLYPECLILKLKKPIFYQDIFFPESGPIFV
jgi:hypothetical protein